MEGKNGLEDSPRGRSLEPPRVRRRRTDAGGDTDIPVGETVRAGERGTAGDHGKGAPWSALPACAEMWDGTPLSLCSDHGSNKNPGWF